MSANPLLAPLSRVRIFAGLTEAQLTAIAKSAERIVYKPGDIITAEGAEAEAAVLIVGGDTECIIEGTPSRVEPIEAGSLVGEMAMFIEHVYGVTTRAAGSARALRIHRKAMHRLMLEDPALADHCVRVIASRLHTVADELRRIDSDLAETIMPSPAATQTEPAATLALPLH